MFKVYVYYMEYMYIDLEPRGRWAHPARGRHPLGRANVMPHIKSFMRHSEVGNMCMHIYIYIYVYTYVYVYLYINYFVGSFQLYSCSRLLIRGAVWQLNSKILVGA